MSKPSSMSSTKSINLMVDFVASRTRFLGVAQTLNARNFLAGSFSRLERFEMKRKAKASNESRKTARVEATNEVGNVEKRFWLMKAEPESRMEKGKDVKFSIDDLHAQKTSPWDGVRSHAAKKHMQAMKVGDLGFFYHSNCKTPGIAGILKVTKEAYPDHTAWDPRHPYYDAKSNAQNPKWWMVEVGYSRHLSNFVPLKRLKTDFKLQGMAMLKQSRLSVSPVRQSEWDHILTLAEEDQAS